MSTNLTLEEIDVWYGQSTQDVDWPSLVREVAPFISYTDRIAFLEISGSDAISPALLLSVAINYKKERKSNFKAYMEQKSVKLMNAYFTSSNRTENQTKKQSNIINTISLFVDGDTKQMDEFVTILKFIKHEAMKFQTKSNGISSNATTIKRALLNDRVLRFPYRLTECWMLSATHHSNQHWYG